MCLRVWKRISHLEFKDKDFLERDEFLILLEVLSRITHLKTVKFRYRNQDKRIGMIYSEPKEYWRCNQVLLDFMEVAGTKWSKELFDRINVSEFAFNEMSAYIKKFSILIQYKINIFEEISLMIFKFCILSFDKRSHI